MPSERPFRPPAHVSKDDATKARASIERLDAIGTVVTRALLALGGGALVFTCVNVTLFGVSHGIPWFIAWMLDPLASLALITVLYVDGVLTEHGGDYKPGGWPFLLRWTAGLSTWLMNCWTSLYPDGTFRLVPQEPDAGGILLHSIAPVLLILLAEAATGYRKYVSRRRGELLAIIAVFETAQVREREENERREREEREREQERERVREDAERDRKAKIEAERQRREAEIEAERERARLERERREAEIEAERERLRLQREQEEIEAARAARAAEIERQRLRTQEELEQERLDREAERQKALVKAQGEADAARVLAEAEAEKLREAERAKQQRALERAAARTRPASESEARGASESGARASISAGRSSESASRNAAALLPAPSISASESDGRIPREVRAQQREEAERYIAKCVLNKIEPDLVGLAQHYGKGETWVGDRVRAARARLESDPEFVNSVDADDALDTFAADDSDNLAIV